MGQVSTLKSEETMKITGAINLTSGHSNQASCASLRQLAVALLLLSLMMLAGCRKPAPRPTLPPPPEAAPSASLSANPASIRSGEATQLTWHTQHATDISIDGLGQVDSNGSRSVSPGESTTYRLIARGPGGEQEATTRVTVAPGATATTTTGGTSSDVDAAAEASFSRNVRDVYFDYDSYTIRSDAQQQLNSNAAWLARHPGVKVTVEGHCDERGSTEFNLALGDSRAHAVKQFLVQAGAGAERIATISYGKERPACTESNEECWQQNRRGHFVLQR